MSDFTWDASGDSEGGWEAVEFHRAMDAHQAKAPVEIVLPSRYFVVFLPTGGCTVPIGEEVAPEAAFSRMEAHQIAANGTSPDFPFADPEAVVIRSTHPLGDWGEHSCAHFVAGKMVFP